MILTKYCVLCVKLRTNSYYNWTNFVLGKPLCAGSIGYDDNFSVQHSMV